MGTKKYEIVRERILQVAGHHELMLHPKASRSLKITVQRLMQEIKYLQSD